MPLWTNIYFCHQKSENHLITMNNVSVDYNEMLFKEFDKPRWSKTILTIISVILSVLCILGYFGIVWFERFGSDLKRICLYQQNYLISLLDNNPLVYFGSAIPNIFGFLQTFTRYILFLLAFSKAYSANANHSFLWLNNHCKIHPYILPEKSSKF